MRGLAALLGLLLTPPWRWCGVPLRRGEDEAGSPHTWVGSGPRLLWCLAGAEWLSSESFQSCQVAPCLFFFDWLKRTGFYWGFSCLHSEACLGCQSCSLWSSRYERQQENPGNPALCLFLGAQGPSRFTFSRLSVSRSFCGLRLGFSVVPSGRIGKRKSPPSSWKKSFYVVVFKMTFIFLFIKTYILNVENLENAKSIKE